MLDQPDVKPKTQQLAELPTRLHHHAAVEGFTTLGRECEVFPYACIGGKTQDLKFKGGRPGLKAGDRNVFREFVTVNAATNGP